MHIPITKRRELISKLLQAEDYYSLAEHYDVRLARWKSPFDCGAYVLGEYNFPATPHMITALHTLPYVPQRAQGIIAYRKENSLAHFGFYDGTVVRSKWGHGPVFLHAIEDIPAEYGTQAVFISKQKALEQLMQEQQMGLFGEGY